MVPDPCLGDYLLRKAQDGWDEGEAEHKKKVADSLFGKHKSQSEASAHFHGVNSPNSELLTGRHRAYD